MSDDRDLGNFWNTTEELLVTIQRLPDEAVGQHIKKFFWQHRGTQEARDVAAAFLIYYTDKTKETK